MSLEPRGAGGPEHPADGSSSRPSMNNRQAGSQPPEPPESKIDTEDMGATALRPLSVDGRDLRDEALLVQLEDGETVPLTAPNVEADDGQVKSRPWYRVVNQHTDWYEGYQNSHIEFSDPEGETVRAPLENSYQPGYGDRYYAKLMDLKRGVERQWDRFSIVMLTLSASTLNANGAPRAPADHMRDIAEGWGTARKQLHQVLSEENWAYARVWEPTSQDGRGPAGYGHMHIAVFVEDVDADLRERDFRPVMESYVGAVESAGWEAHSPQDSGAVSVTQKLEVANAATYISEYIGQYGDELPDRPIHERAFLATAWATGTRRVEFGGTAQEFVSGEEFRRETGLRPQDRGEGDGDSGGSEAAESDEANGWTFQQLCRVDDEPNYYEPSDGGVSMSAVDAVDADPPRDLGPPPE